MRIMAYFQLERNSPSGNRPFRARNDTVLRKLYHSAGVVADENHRLRPYSSGDRNVAAPSFCSAFCRTPVIPECQRQTTQSPPKPFWHRVSDTLCQNRSCRTREVWDNPRPLKRKGFRFPLLRSTAPIFCRMSQTAALDGISGRLLPRNGTADEVAVGADGDCVGKLAASGKATKSSHFHCVPFSSP